MARSGGTIELSDSRIENNSAVGLLADSSSSLHFFAGYVLPPGGSPGNVTGNTAGNIIGYTP